MVALAAAGLSACGGSIRAASTTRSVTTTSTGRYVPPPAGIATVQLFHPLELYTAYAEQTLGQLRGRLASLQGAIAAGDRPLAERRWLTAHLTWLLVGQDDDAYGAFGDLGDQIDGTTAGVVGGTHSTRFTGFHRVELDLWHGSPLTTATKDTAHLVRLVGKLTPQLVSADLPTTTPALDGWVLRAHEILEDALRDSLSQDDDYGSNSDLASLTADVGATQEMLAVLSPLIVPRAPKIVPTAERQLRALDTAVLAVRTANGFPAISALPARSREQIDSDTGAALETLAPISELMQISGVPHER